MATTLRTENDTMLKGLSFQKVLLADSGKKFNFIKLNGVNQTFTNNKEHTVTFPAGDEDGEIIVCQETDVVITPTVRVRILALPIPAIVQFGYGGQIIKGEDNPSTIVRDFTVGETLTLICTISDTWFGAFIAQHALNDIVVVSETPQIFAPNVAGKAYYVFTMLITKDTDIQITTQQKPTQPLYSINISASGGGSISRSVASVTAGGSASVFITPSAGYRIKSITVNTQPLTTFNASGHTVQLTSINANQNVHAIFELTNPNTNATNAVINWTVYDRYIGSNTQALQNDRSTFINANITERVTKKNDVVLPAFALPYSYTSDKLTLETTWDIGRTSIDEFIDNLNSNYLRLAINTIGKDGGNLYITTRLNNSYANAGAGFTPAQVAFCRMKVTDPNGQSLFYNHPVLSSITDLTHTVPLTIVGVYTFETETILVGSNLRTSYSKAFTELIIQ